MWAHLGLSVDNVYSGDDPTLSPAPSSRIDVGLDISPAVRPIKAFKKWQHHADRGPNDLNCPPEILTIRLDSVDVEVLFNQSSAPSSASLGSDRANFLSDAIVATVDSSLRSLLSRKSRLAKGVRKGDEVFNNSLRATFPSIFWPAYTEAVSRRTKLAPAITRSLAAFYSRLGPNNATSRPITDFGLSVPAHKPTTRASDSTSHISCGLEAQLWEAMLTTVAVSERDSWLPSMSLTKPKPKVFNVATATDLQGLILSKHELHTREPEAASLDRVLACHSPLGAAADQARDFDHDLLSREQLEDIPTTQNNDDAATCSSTSFEELAGKHMLLNSSPNEASSQGSAVNSDVYGFADELRLYEHSNRDEDFELWEELIGQCAELTQTPIRDDPLDDPLLTGRLRYDCRELYLEDLHTSTVSFTKDASSDRHTVIDIDTISCVQFAHQSANPLRECSATSIDDSTCAEVFNLFEFDQFIPTPAVIVQGGSSNTLFDTNDSDMHATEDDSQGWNLELPLRATLATHTYEPTSQLHRRTTSHFEPETSQQQFSSRPFVKRPSTVSTLSASTASPPKRHESLLKRLSRSSSKASKHEELEMTDFDLDKIRGRSVELKRRKTLQDYDLDEDQDDDEMLFV